MSLQRCRCGWTLVDLLIVIAVLGAGFLLMLPGLQASRESTNRTICSNNLKQMGLAVHNYHDVMKTFPSSDLGAGYLSWAVQILPYMEQAPLYEKFDLRKKWSSEQNTAAMTADSASIPVYLCPTRRAGVQRCEDAGSAVPGATGDYAPPQTGSGNLWDTNRSAKDNGSSLVSATVTLNEAGELTTWRSRTRFANLFDGTSKTILFSEKHVSKENLNKGGENKADSCIYAYDHDWQDWAVVRSGHAPIRKGPDDPGGATAFGSWHPDMINCLFADGSVQIAASSMDISTFARLCDGRDGTVADISERVSKGWFGVMRVNTPKTFPVSGGVTLAGKPLAAGQIVFFDSRHDITATGDIGPDGKYRLGTLKLDDGAPTGSYKVLVLPPFSYESQASFGRYESPEKTPLAVEIKSGENTFDIELAADEVSISEADPATAAARLEAERAVKELEARLKAEQAVQELEARTKAQAAFDEIERERNEVLEKALRGE